jgi:saccharopine dehydrogenase-like NADP-dependent oxidoreductase
MRILLVGAAGVGTALARIAARRPFAELVITAVNPVVALELIEGGAWSGAGVLGPEALPPRPFLDLLTGYGSPWACEERSPAGS